MLAFGGVLGVRLMRRVLYEREKASHTASIHPQRAEKAGAVDVGGARRIWSPRKSAIAAMRR